MNSFFNLDNKWKVVVYRVGLVFMCLSLLGLILLAINANYHWGEDVWKNKKKPKFNGKIEKFFYLYGYFILIIIAISLLASLF